MQLGRVLACCFEEPGYLGLKDEKSSDDLRSSTVSSMVSLKMFTSKVCPSLVFKPNHSEQRTCERDQRLGLRGYPYEQRPGIY